MPSSCPVLILNYNGWSDTERLLGHLQDSELDLWVVDNGSPEKGLVQLQSRYPDVRTLALDHNWGWAGGYNRAIEHVRRLGATHVYLLNNDTLPAKGAIEQAVSSLRSLPDAAAVGSVMLTDDGRQVFFDGDFHYSHKAAADLSSAARSVDRLHGGGMAIDLAAFEKVGPFHEDYFLYHEESEWCLRARAAGFNLYVDGASRIVHEGQGSDTGHNAAYYLVRNRYLALHRGYPLDPISRSRQSLVIWDLADARQHSGDRRAAILEGLLDGLSKRFGKRPPKGRPAWVREAAATSLWWMVTPFRVLRRLRMHLSQATGRQAHSLDS